MRTSIGEIARYIRRHRKNYLRYTLLSFLVVQGFFIAQIVFVVRDFQPQYAIVPSLLGLTIGLLLSWIISLREDMAQQRSLFRAVADFAREFTYYRRNDGTYEYVSPACHEITGYPPEAFFAHPAFMDELVHADDREHWKQHVHHMLDGDHTDEVLVRIIHRDGRVRWLSHHCSPVHDEDGALLGVRSTNQDVTERVEAERQLRDLASFDPLTGLPNRRMLMEQMVEHTQACQKGQPFAVLFLDLDRFKHVNDTYGHSYGDDLLRNLAERLKSCCPGNAFLCRFGGDEFVILLPDIPTPDDAAAFARKLLEKLEQPFRIGEHKFFISGSIGIALCPYDGESPEALIRNADVAMYRAKLDGRGAIGFYSSELVKNAAEFLDMETRIREGLERNEFCLHYQPRVRLSDHTIVGVEALARWRNGEDWIAPDRFIPVAEETGLIDRLTTLLLHEAASQASRWPGLRISFNLSGRQFRRKDMPEWLHDIVTEAGGCAAQFEMEITESILLEARDTGIAHINTLREMGYRIALDDFGTGYSSLAYLRDLPLDVVKLDGSFIRGMQHNVKDHAVVRAVVLLCRETGMEMVAEGLETEVQFQLARSQAITEGQGYLLARPMPAAALDEHLARQGYWQAYT